MENVTKRTTYLKSDDQQNSLDGGHVRQQTVDLVTETDQSAVHQDGDKSHNFHDVLCEKN